MPDQPMNANSMQLQYNDDLEDYNSSANLGLGGGAFGGAFFGNSKKFGDLQNSLQSIEDTRNKQKESFAKSENDRWNAPNPLAPKVSSLGPLESPDLLAKGTNGTGIEQNNLISSNFNTSSEVAANGLFGGDQIENSFSRPLAPQQLPEETGISNLYNNNKTV
tara:strand:- start:186 stop:674 length:489 start_codon:yes stop_codon:yes gene_type:complete